MHKLIIEDDEGKTTVVPLVRDEFTIGRKEGNTIRLTERNVSRRHARLFKSNGSLYIEDLQSYNGVKINGERISGRTALSEGARVQIGDYQLALQLERIGADTAPIEKPTALMPADSTAVTVAPAASASQSLPPGQIAPTRIQPQTDARTPEPPARLVAVSSNFAGREFMLDKPALVIGRTEDNDIVLDHRSISRHHAQIVNEAGRYSVVDLQSANGVRVNGEQYGKVELRRGDYVDLGHVRLRFVAGNEDFVFARDAQIIDVPSGPPRSKAMLIAGILIAGVIIVGVASVALVKMFSGAETRGTTTDVDTRVAKLNAECDVALHSLDWDTAFAKAEAGLSYDPNNEPLRDKKNRAETERINREKYEKFLKAANAQRFDDAVNLYQQISKNSIYLEKSEESYTGIKRSYIKEHLDAARALPNTRCEEIRRHTDSVALVDEHNAEAIQIANRCTQLRALRPTQVAPRPGTDEPKGQAEPVNQPHPPTPPRPTPPVAAPEKPPSAGPEADVDQGKLLEEAYDDYVHGSYSTALEKARRANKMGSTAKAWRVIGGSSCFLKDRQGAVMAWNRLDNQGRQFLKYVCTRNQIEIP